MTRPLSIEETRRLSVLGLAARPTVAGRAAPSRSRGDLISFVVACQVSGVALSACATASGWSARSLRRWTRATKPAVAPARGHRSGGPDLGEEPGEPTVGRHNEAISQNLSLEAAAFSHGHLDARGSLGPGWRVLHFTGAAHRNANNFTDEIGQLRRACEGWAGYESLPAATIEEILARLAEPPPSRRASPRRHRLLVGPCRWRRHPRRRSVAMDHLEPVHRAA